MKKIIMTCLIIVVCLTISAFLLVNRKSEKTRLIMKHPSNHLSNSYKPYKAEALLSAAGDFLVHSQVYTDALTGQNKYNFNPMLQEIRSFFKDADLAFINQESVLGGASIGVSSYPSFNSPYEAGDALINAGIDIVNMANNHTLDKGPGGIYNAITYYEKKGLTYIGAYKNTRDSLTPRVINKNGIKFGFLGYTYGTNGIPVPSGKRFLVNLMDVEKMKRDIKEIKPLSDFVIVSVHWGMEYQRFPNEDQERIAAILADAGTDVIIGHHPHVLQPMEWIAGKNGRRTLVVYSLGNFLSGQQGEYKDIGGIVQIPFTKSSSGTSVKASVGNPEFIPTIVTNQDKEKYRVKILKDVNPKLNRSIENHVLSPLKTIK
ncbi:CapA family protein [Metabacillus sp. KIGAM252]|uniref:CapA family protein n=1 Tax=Metabacillus flavus TaxID=2823519 RepID=A0ABS5LEU7_9BACI|nr:CapA family protein [Metabacillus flavus]MBS2969126.1 CapA family protein [Metabacillus flavus]